MRRAARERMVVDLRRRESLKVVLKAFWKGRGRGGGGEEEEFEASSDADESRPVVRSSVSL